MGDVVCDDDGHDVPSAAPLILLYGAAARRSRSRTTRWHTCALAAGYLAGWTAFSLAATSLQRVLASLFLVTPMMEAGSSRVTGTLLVVAGCICWALMLLLFAGGVMNEAVIVGLAAWVAVEKLAPFGHRSAQFSGAVMILLGLWMLMR